MLRQFLLLEARRNGFDILFNPAIQPLVPYHRSPSQLPCEADREYSLLCALSYRFLAGLRSGVYARPHTGLIRLFVKMFDYR
jgi:hypothetical protein